MLERDSVVIGFLFLRYKLKIIQQSSDGFIVLTTDTMIGLFHILTTDIIRNGAETAENC